MTRQTAAGATAPRPPVPAWRLLRERALRQADRLRQRAARAAAAPSLPAAAGLTVRGIALPATAHGLPVSTAGLFRSLDCRGPVLLLAGQVVSLYRQAPEQGQPWAEIDGRRLGATPVGDLAACLITLLEGEQQRVLSWVAERQASADPLHLQAGRRQMSPAAREAVAAFVTQELVPRLQAEAAGTVPLVAAPVRAPLPAVGPQSMPTNGAEDGASAQTEGTGLAEPQPLGIAAVTDDEALMPQTDDDLVIPPRPGWSQQIATTILQRWPRWRAFVGLNCHDLAPYWGMPRPGQLCLRYGKGVYAGIHRRPADVACADQDQALETAVLEVLGEAPCPHLELEPVYQDAGYTVLVSSSGVHYCCRQIPAFVLEDERGRLYRFPPVQVGICLHTPVPAQVLLPGAVVIMHPYEHPFLFAGITGAPLCMPCPPEFYRSLARLPLAEGLLQLLESARLTLCAGYYRDNPYRGYYHPSLLPGHQVSEQTAASDGLPVYRYDRQPARR